MTEHFLSDEVALRIALASRALQNAPLPKLIDALQTCLGEDLDEAALSRIKVADLKAAFGGSYNLDGEDWWRGDECRAGSADRRRQGDRRDRACRVEAGALEVLWRDPRGRQRRGGR